MNKNISNGYNEKPFNEAVYIRCPYDRRHFVLEKTFEHHLNSCRQHHPKVNLLFCPFNTSHRCRNMEQLV